VYGNMWRSELGHQLTGGKAAGIGPGAQEGRRESNSLASWSSVAASLQLLHNELLLLVSDACLVAAIIACHTQTDIISAIGVLFVCDAQLKLPFAMSFCVPLTINYSVDYISKLLMHRST
jgi:hypothetical protein